ncbi:hypothetical protein C9374_008373 [Naegleria lovaniensis]|uniref:Uncharacterized protein n=1 Tax=Naegleria lovaniensis TaxID=51637 RepID=A0AA88GK27_NAELO|nr:uncharacterized protein C9374_008373 [Naegleria lovaniensis]KAG2378230.1 hypothetical protein C9374_008373 [Naegleria lovaniensis]
MRKGLLNRCLASSSFKSCIWNGKKDGIPNHYGNLMEARCHHHDGLNNYFKIFHESTRETFRHFSITHTGNNNSTNIAFHSEHRGHIISQTDLPVFKFSRQHLLISKIKRFMNTSNLSKKCVFFVGPDGCGKSHTIVDALKKVEETNPNAVSIYLDFETYFLKTIQEMESTQLPIDFEHFTDYFDNTCLEQLIKCADKAGDKLQVSDVEKILTERLSINYSFLKMIESRDDLINIIIHDEDMNQLFQKLKNSTSTEDVGYDNRFSQLFQKLSMYLPFYDSPVKNSLRLAIDTLAFVELYSRSKKRTGMEVLTFFFSTLEFMAISLNDIHPKLFINGLQYLDVFSKSVALLSRNDIRQFQTDIPEEIYSNDDRGSNLHDAILLRMVALYVDPFIPTLIEVSGNYYNYQMREELKMDMDQVIFVELIEESISEAKLSYSYLFDEKINGTDCFEQIYDIVGGNPIMLKTFYEKYYTPLYLELKNSFHSDIRDATKAKSTNLFTSSSSVYQQAILNYLNGEKEKFERKLHMALLLTARYLALRDYHEHTLNRSLLSRNTQTSIQEIQELSILDQRVQFTLHDAIEKVLALKGVIYHFNIEQFDTFIPTVGASALLNSELLYYQHHESMLRPYDQSYYSYFAKTLEDMEASWSWWQRVYYRTIWQPLFGLKNVNQYLGKHGDRNARQAMSRFVNASQF